MSTGIYCIENISNKKIYIGQSKNIEKRLLDHKIFLKIGQHPNKHLQNSYNKYGKKHFLFCIIEKTDDIKLLNKKENKWINYYKSFIGENGYNIRYPVEGCIYSVMFYSEQYSKIKEYAKKHGQQTIGSVIRYAVTLFLKREDS